ncbi:MAG: hypothetical protein HY078_05360 [Elusimicrobia bacterium]|nr:hypothetical protein [Elusimicrobiota bacterium]
MKRMIKERTMGAMAMVASLAIGAAGQVGVNQSQQQPGGTQASGAEATFADGGDANGKPLGMRLRAREGALVTPRGKKVTVGKPKSPVDGKDACAGISGWVQVPKRVFEYDPETGKLSAVPTNDPLRIIIEIEWWRKPGEDDWACIKDVIVTIRKKLDSVPTDEEFLKKLESLDARIKKDSSGVVLDGGKEKTQTTLEFFRREEGAMQGNASIQIDGKGDAEEVPSGR